MAIDFAGECEKRSDGDLGVKHCADGSKCCHKPVQDHSLRVQKTALDALQQLRRVVVRRAVQKDHKLLPEIAAIVRFLENAVHVFCC